MRKLFETRFLVESLLTLFLVLSGSHCASQKPFWRRPLITEENDSRAVARPKEKKLNLYEDGIENLLGREIEEAANLAWHIRNLTNNHKQAKNTNALDEVPNSAWFTNRHGKYPMSLEELRRGPNRGSGPDVEEPLTIVGAKIQGVSPGFRVKDSKDDVYFIKFDRKDYPQLNTAAELITTKFVYAAGYNTPENYLSIVDPKKLLIAEDVMVKNRWGRDVPMMFEYVRQILDKAHRNPDGTYRVIASKLLEGDAIGPFSFAGTRKDDPNDRIPHQHRRELRGYQVIAAWLNNPDAKASNTLDMYVRNGDGGFVRHCLIDFGTSLGSSGYGAAGPGRGHTSVFDLGRLLKKILTLGLWVEPWEKEKGPVSPSVGYFDSRLFDPGDFAFIIPNPAFQRMTELDGFWGAKIVMSFTDEQIKAVVEIGEYENPEDEMSVINTLIERRDKTGRYWYSRVNPLDNFRISRGANGERGLRFDDLAVTAGFEDPSASFYRYKLMHQGKELTHYFIRQGEPFLEFNFAILQKINNVLQAQSGDSVPDNIFYFIIQTRRGKQGNWGKQVKVHFHHPAGNGGMPQVVALEREN